MSERRSTAKGVIFIAILFFSVASLCNSAFGQITIRGKVVDEKGRPLSAVSIVLFKRTDLSIVNFAITDDKGAYAIKINDTFFDSLVIKAALLGYGEQVKAITQAKLATIDFRLELSAINLPEVRVKPSPLWQRRDTINYNTSEFQRPQDRVIGDIIRRLPGMEVTEAGQIRYNGKPINKYYIEGLDLLEDRYGIANNNIPADAVEKVQVLENHQPIKVLDSVQYSDRAALNIKLKSNAKMRLIGTGKAGAGFSPLLYEAEATPMLFKKKFQGIATYKYNNTGIDIKREVNAQNRGEYSNAIENGALKNDLLAIAKFGRIPVSPQRSLFNSTHVLTANFLLPVCKNYQLRVNASYINDFQRQQTALLTRYYLAQGTLIVNEKNNFHTNDNRIQTDVSVIANTKAYYLKNLLKLEGYWASGISYVQSGSFITQRLENPFFSITNEFSLIRARKKYISSVSSYMGYVVLPQKLSASPGLYKEVLNNDTPFDKIIQRASLHTAYTDNYFSFQQLNGRFRCTYKFGCNLQDQVFSSGILKETGVIQQPAPDLFVNELHWQRARAYGVGSWAYESDRWHFSLSLPANYTFIQYFDRHLAVDMQRNKLFSNPSLNLTWDISPNWRFNMGVSSNGNFGDIRSVSPGFILIDYRTLVNNEAFLAKYRTISSSSEMVYRNPRKVLFFSIGSSYVITNNNMIVEQVVNGNLETLTTRPFPNQAIENSVYSRASKYFLELRTLVAINASFGDGQLQQIQQGGLSNFRYRNHYVEISVDSKFTENFSMRYTGSARWVSFDSGDIGADEATINGSQKVAVYYAIKRGFAVTAVAEQYFRQDQFSRGSSYYFADAAIRYRFRKKFEMELSMQNLFNTRHFTSIILSNNIETKSDVLLRPRQLLLKAIVPF